MAGILTLGNLEFEEDGTDAAKIQDDKSLQQAAKLFGLDVDGLKDSDPPFCNEDGLKDSNSLLVWGKGLRVFSFV